MNITIMPTSVVTFETQMTIATLMSMLLQWVKTNPKFLPMINHTSEWMNRIVATILAALTAAGIGFSWDTATHSLTLSNLTFMTILTFVWAVARQYTMQHLAYKVMYPDQTPQAEASAK